MADKEPTKEEVEKDWQKFQEQLEIQHKAKKQKKAATPYGG